MAAIAARTERVRIGTSVLIVPYRNPLVLAKSLATIDRIAHGRVVLGIGVGWMAEEFEALGLGDLWAERGTVTDEYVAVCIDLWTQQGPSSFSGRFVEYTDVGANPRPVQRPHIPIWVGGKTKPAIRRVARYGSGYHSVASSPAELAGEVAAVRAEVERAGRDPDQIVVSMLAAFVEGRPAAELVDLVGEYRDAGLHHLVGVPTTRIGPSAATTDAERLDEALEDLERFAAEVLPAVR
jgi:probable F420-dependent oxidoreductase